MRFKDANSVATIVYFLRQADVPRSVNRALINELFNGSQPFTETEAEQNNINTNVNFLDAAKIAHDARNTFNNAFLKPGTFFNVGLDWGPVYKRSGWGRIITKEINKPLKKSRMFMETLRAEFAQTVLHGVGPSSWMNRYNWCPSSVAIDDLMIPSKTKVSMENLDYFAIYRQFTPAKLYKLTHGKVVDPGWNKKLVDQLIKKAAEEYITNAATNQWYTPEKLVESIKSDTTFFDNEAIPTINVWDFFFKDDESEDQKWHRRMIVDYGSEVSSGTEFLYDPKRPFADDLSHIMHIMFGDGANVAPFRYHSVRGIGWLLYGVCHLQNRLRCKFNDAVFENMLWYFRVNSPEDRERLSKVDLQHLGVIPDGLQWVPAAERYTINPALINEAFSINRQSMAESSAQFRPDFNDGTAKEMTATETMARVNSANALQSSTLNLAYTHQSFMYEEIARRFAIKNSLDPDVKKFREACLKQGVPEEALDIEKWNIETERVLGAGNKILELAQSKELMAIRPLFDPESQQEVLHIFTEALTDNPQLADRLVPRNEKPVSDAVHDAQLASASLLMGLPLAMKKGLNHIEYIEALLVSMGAKIQQIQNTPQQMGTAEDIMGLQNMANHIGQHIEVLAQDKGEKERVKRYGDALGNLMNIVKSFAQRLQASMASQNGQGGQDGETQGKIASQVILAQTKAQIAAQNAELKRQQRQADFEQRQAQSAQSHQVELGKQATQAQLDAAVTELEAAARIKSNNANTQPTE